MELSDVEQSLIFRIREAMETKHMALKKYVEELEKERHELKSANRYLQAWNYDLVSALNEHGAIVPASSGSQLEYYVT